MKVASSLQWTSQSNPYFSSESTIIVTNETSVNMKISGIVLLCFCVVISAINCVDAACAQQNLVQKRTTLEDKYLYNMLALLKQEEEEKATMIQDVVTVYCYDKRDCCGKILGTGTSRFCCNDQGGASYKPVKPDKGKQPCSNCS